MNAQVKQPLSPIKAWISLLRDLTSLCLVALLISLTLGGLAYLVYSGSPKWLMPRPLLALVFLLIYIPSIGAAGGLHGNPASIALRVVVAVFVTAGLLALAYGGFAVWQAVMEPRNGAVVPCLLLVVALGVAAMKFGQVFGGPVRARIRVMWWLPQTAALAFAAGAVFGIWLLWGVIRMRRSKPWTGAAWWVYKYSLLYLALLFVAMVVDRKL